jgi:hypothetical protein
MTNHIIGTLKEGYPLLQHEDAVPTQLSLAAWWTTPDPTMRTAPGPPRGQRRRYTPRYQQWVRTPTGKCRLLYIQTGPSGKVQDLHGCKPDPWDESRTPLCGVRTTHSRIPWFRDKEYPDLNQGQAGVRSWHVSGPYRVRFCSPLRRRPDAATWPTARDVSQRAEPDVRPLGRATSAFIADRFCFLCV